MARKVPQCVVLLKAVEKYDFAPSQQARRCVLYEKLWRGRRWWQHRVTRYLNFNDTLSVGAARLWIYLRAVLSTPRRERTNGPARKIQSTQGGGRSVAVYVIIVTVAAGDGMWY
jgi:hypothetical protein